MWLVFFLYTAVAAFFVQLVLLPYLLPGMHYGHGLFVLDSTGFHQEAQEQAAAMMKYGWKAWHLRPYANYPAGVASIFYYLLYPEPFSLIPFNAALQATAGCFIVFLLLSFLENRIAALSGGVLFVLDPTSLAWTSQIHRDGTFILGNLLVLSAWVLILKGIKEGNWRKFTYSIFIYLAGIMAIWAPRPYWTDVVSVACAILILVMFICMLAAWCKGASGKAWYAAAFLSLCLMLVLQQPFRYTEKALQSPLQDWDEAGETFSKTGEQHSVEWHFNPYVPKYIDFKLYIISQCRFHVTLRPAASSIDNDINFESAADYLPYLPRALQIGFLSPFPSMWFTQGSSAGTTVGRAVLGIVTLFFYFCIAFFVLSLHAYRRKPIFWLIVLFCTYGLLVFTYVYPNIGTLVRFRYCFYMTIVCIGFAFMVEKLIYSRKAKAINKAEA